MDFAGFLFWSRKSRDPQNIKESKTFTSFVDSSIVDAKLDFVSTTSHKIYWYSHFLQNFSPPTPPWINVDESEIIPRLCYRQTTDAQYWYRGGGGGLHAAIFWFFWEKILINCVL